MDENDREIRIKLSGLLQDRFEWIKSSLGIRQESEVLRFLIHHFYRNNYKENSHSNKERGTKKGTMLIDKIMEKYRDGMDTL
ncbi:MAG: hypothetical protein R6U96_15800 [Promethearchaeia archaeon]